MKSAGECSGPEESPADDKEKSGSGLPLPYEEGYPEDIKHANSDHENTDQWSIGCAHITHYKRNECTSGNGHNQQTRYFIGTFRHFCQCQRENNREHISNT